MLQGLTLKLPYNIHFAGLRNTGKYLNNTQDQNEQIEIEIVFFSCVKSEFECVIKTTWIQLSAAVITLKSTMFTTCSYNTKMR